jgi:hypothetical protein
MQTQEAWKVGSEKRYLIDLDYYSPTRLQTQTNLFIVEIIMTVRIVINACQTGSLGIIICLNDS